jgi:hypothetical protein
MWRKLAWRLVLILELSPLPLCYPLGREHLVNLLVGRARIFVYYIRYTNVRASIFGPIEPSAQNNKGGSRPKG